MNTEILIVGSGCAGLYAALTLPKERQITIITKSDLESSDSFLAQGGMCMLNGKDDYDSYYEDTMKAGHYENDPRSVELMIKSSPEVVDDLVDFGVDFTRNEDGTFVFTKEGAHSNKRILFHKDITGKEITSNLLAQVKNRENITLMQHTTLVDLLCYDNTCYGAVVTDCNNVVSHIKADYTLLATGGIGGLYRHSTNYKHLTADAIAIALNRGIETKNLDYVQIHPTTLYSDKEEERSFLISESVRGEGARLYDKNMNPFVNELLPRDLLTKAIYEQMKKDGTNYVWEDLRTIPSQELHSHFPNIVAHCLKMGYDVTKECIPVVPAQHYFMGGIKVNYESKTSMEHLYAIGETACNGVHGKNRLASNSLLESLVFAKRAALDIINKYETLPDKDTADMSNIDSHTDLDALKTYYSKLVLDEINAI